MVNFIKNGNEQEIEMTIVPKLKPYLDLSLTPGDTIVAFIDHNIWQMSDAQEFYKLLEKTFPCNSICVLFDGVELGVIHKHDK